MHRTYRSAYSSQTVTLCAACQGRPDYHVAAEEVAAYLADDPTVCDACGAVDGDPIRIGDWRDLSTGQTYRAAYVNDMVLTGPEHAILSDTDLLAEAEAERRRGAR